MTIAPVIVKKVEQNEDTQQMACANSISLCNPAMIKLNTSFKQDNRSLSCTAHGLQRNKSIVIKLY